MSFTALIDYQVGNLLSVSKALEQVGAQVRIISSPEEAAGSDRLILPGVGNFGDGMTQLRKSGFADLVTEWVRAERPFLGICLGMQLLLDGSDEAPGVAGLGVIPGRVKRFPPGPGKVPHIGWNQITRVPDAPYMDAVPENAWFYFVHSFYVEPSDPAVTGAYGSYNGVQFSAVLARKNLLAVQFHPEKSQDNGLALLKRFVCSADADRE